MAAGPRGRRRPWRRRSLAEIEQLLIRADRMFGDGLLLDEVCSHLGISRSTFYRWQRRCGLQERKRALTAADLAAIERLLALVGKVGHGGEPHDVTDWRGRGQWPGGVRKHGCPRERARTV